MSQQSQRCLQYWDSSETSAGGLFSRCKEMRGCVCSAGMDHLPCSVAWECLKPGGKNAVELSAKQGTSPFPSYYRCLDACSEVPGLAGVVVGGGGSKPET